MPEAGRGLVIVRCGRSSQHPRWLSGARAAEWDLQLVPYQAGDADWPTVIPGHKWDGLARYLAEDRRWQDYDYIWLPDDDLETDGDGIAALFDACRARNAPLAQPALTEDSFWSYIITLANRSFAERETTFVEVMAPVFRRDFLEQVLPTFALSHRGAGWGLSWLWADPLRYRDTWIFDRITVRHARPVGTLRNKALDLELYNAMQDLLARHGLRALRRTLRAWDDEGRLHEADEGPFLLRYLQGYSYVIEAQPWMFRRTIKDQVERPRIPRRGWRRLAQNLHWPRWSRRP